MDKNMTKLYFDNNEKYKIGKIWKNAIYAKK